MHLYQKETPTQVFSCEICEIFKNIVLTEHSRWLLLLMVSILITLAVLSKSLLTILQQLLVFKRSSVGGWGPTTINKHHPKFGIHKCYGSADISFLIYHVIM